MSEFELTPQPLPMDEPNTDRVFKNVKRLKVGAGDSVFKVEAPQGIWLGAAAFEDAPFRVDMAGNVTAETLDLTGTTLKGGQTAYNTGTGHWIGLDSGTPKFSIGNGSTKYLTWDGSALTIRGTLNADDITAGTLTGRTVKAKGTGVTTDVWLDGSIGQISFLYGSDEKAFIYTNSSGDVLFDADVDMALNPTGDLAMDPGGDTYITNGNLFVTNGDVTADNYNFNDFAEMFEAVEEFSTQKIPIGTSVVLVGNKIRPANEGEEPFGVVSATAGLVLGQGNRWAKKYIQDDFGRYQYEDVQIWRRLGDGKNEKGVIEDGQQPPEGAKIFVKKRRKINPEFDPLRTYIPRKERSEWNVVGLVGQVRLKKNQPTAKHWKKMRNISPEIEEWLIR